jgi:protein-S-isoprenylcysteine O-methyltransferase Ste14
VVLVLAKCGWDWQVQSVQMKQFLFLSSILIEILYILLFVLTIKRPNFRFWPPPSHRSWQFFAAWLLASLVFVGFFFVGLLDFNSAFLRAWVRFPIGLLLHIIGGLIGTWAFMTFDLRTTIGLGDKLITDGPYRYSRNPQYIADILHILGFMVLTNSWMTWVIGILGIVLNILAPFTEEPWLECKFGEPYLAYKKAVPRFMW